MTPTPQPRTHSLSTLRKRFEEISQYPSFTIQNADLLEIAASLHEAEAAPSALEVEVLAEALASITGLGIEHTEHGDEYDIEGAALIAAEYTRLRAAKP